MKKIYFISIAVAIAASCISVHLITPNNKQSITNIESSYERVLRTGTLRCAYGLWEPAVMRDPNTGELSGIVYDIMQEAGKALNLNVEFNLEVPWDSVSTALITHKADAHCAGIWATPSRGRNMAFTTPMFFSPTVAFARADDTRFDYNLEAINNSNVTVALSDDDITVEIYKADFPKASTYEIPQLSGQEELLVAIAAGKADVTFNSPTRLKTYNKLNAEKMKIIPSTKPLRIFQNTVATDIHESALIHMLNTTFYHLIDNGTVDKIIKKYQKEYDTDFIVPVRRPYKWQVK